MGRGLYFSRSRNLSRLGDRSLQGIHQRRPRSHQWVEQLKEDLPFPPLPA